MQVFLYPCGMLLSWILPDWGFRAFGTRISLNPGPWTYKEQILATLIVNVSYTSAYVFWNIQTQEIYYGEQWLTPGYKILLLISTQCMGLGFAGLLRRFVVYPSETIWPNILPTVALNRALLVSDEKKEKIHGWSLSRYSVFWIVFWGMFVYFWLPDYLFPALSFFAWMTWIKPNNFVSPCLDDRPLICRRSQPWCCGRFPTSRGGYMLILIFVCRIWQLLPALNSDWDLIPGLPLTGTSSARTGSHLRILSGHP